MPTFTVLSIVSILIGSAIEILPTLVIHTYTQSNDKVDPYTSLELAGRDIYVREGCYTCHSQMIRTIPSEVLRYGFASLPEESMYDRPFQWGSKRSGPDLARVGGKYPDLWHFRHMLDPRSVTPNSLMPAYPWLFEDKIAYDSLEKKLEVMKSLGVPYSNNQVLLAALNAREQARKISQALAKDTPIKSLEDREIVAVIAYLQRLGKNPRLFESNRMSAESEKGVAR
jgi:cytochrome c oxidase cbb3-type subunit I/II